MALKWGVLLFGFSSTTSASADWPMFVFLRLSKKDFLPHAEDQEDQEGYRFVISKSSLLAKPSIADFFF